LALSYIFYYKFLKNIIFDKDMKLKLTLILPFLFFASALHAQNFWTNVGQFSGISSFVCKSNYVLAGNLSGIYRTTNNGTNWIQLSFSGSVLSLTLDNQGRIFAGTQSGGIYLSTNDGASWAVTGLDTGSISTLAVNSSNHIFAGSPGVGMYRSTNNGASWTQINTGLLHKTVFSISFNSAGTIFLGTGGKVHRSVNNGDAWLVLGTSPYHSSLAVNLANELIAGAIALDGNSSTNNLFKSTDDGNNWSPITTIPGSCLSYIVAISPTGDIYASSEGPCVYVYRSTNGGSSWLDVSSGLMMNFLSIAGFGFAPSGFVFGGQQMAGYVYRSSQPLLGINVSSEFIPGSFQLHQNYPNPFNPVTKIKFSLPLTSEGGVHIVRLVVYDVLGREVANLISPLRGGQEGLNPGTYEVDFDGANYPSGVYYYKLIAGDASSPQANPLSITKKMVLVK
jgi:photosystem II stability/assembly factor-like uncharacterized protein